MGALDSGPDDASPDGERFLHAVQVMQEATNTSMEAVLSGADSVSADDADEVVRGCKLLRDLGERHHNLTAGPLQAERQVWVAVPAREQAALVQALYVDGAHPHQQRERALVKPPGIGLYTSTQPVDCEPPWLMYLRLYYGSDIHPLPWGVYVCEPVADVRAYEVATAGDWVELHRRYPESTPSGIVPDWSTFSREFTCVHICLQAVVALQGMRLRLPGGVSAPAFYDIETTFWVSSQVIKVQLTSLIR